MNAGGKQLKPITEPAAPARLTVMQIQVEPAQVWFRCPRCEEALEAYLSDPRGQMDITCENCGAEFDIPAAAALILI